MRRIARIAAAPVATIQFNIDVSTIAFNKDAFPPLPAYIAGRTESFSLPNKPGMSRVSLQAQYQAFVHFAVTSSAALSAIAPNGPRSGTFQPARALSIFQENSGIRPQALRGQ